jgi:hypothetical protein
MAVNYICTGRVLPERADVSFSRIELGLEQGGTARLSWGLALLASALLHVLAPSKMED